jgi:ribulose-5-phosphate 4-epimerase/fuculose-1-phosphate aldolase
MTSTTQIPAPADETTEDLVIGNKILYWQKVVDAFGHLSVRHDRDPMRYLMSRYVPPGLVTADDIVTFDLDSNPLDKTGLKYYSERFIHGEIYKLRPDVKAIVHCHAPQLIPFAATRVPLRPLYHMSAFLACRGCGVPIFDIREAAGMTDMLIRTPDLGQALAASLADKPMVLMRGHGATLVGDSIKQVVYRSVYAVENAALQMDAMRLGEPVYLADEEAVKAAESADKVVERPWALWRCEAVGEP